MAFTRARPPALCADLARGLISAPTWLAYQAKWRDPLRFEYHGLTRRSDAPALRRWRRRHADAAHAASAARRCAAPRLRRRAASVRRSRAPSAGRAPLRRDRSRRAQPGERSAKARALARPQCLARPLTDRSGARHPSDKLAPTTGRSAGENPNTPRTSRWSTRRAWSSPARPPCRRPMARSWCCPAPAWCSTTRSRRSRRAATINPSAVDAR